MGIIQYKLSMNLSSSSIPIPVFVISLPRSIDRREMVAQNLTRLGVSFKVLEAVDGKLLTPEQGALYSSSRAKSEFGRWLTPGEIGCALSHIGIYEGMVSEGTGVALILEDDVILSEAAPSAIRDLLTSDFEWEFVNLISDSPEKLVGRISDYSGFSLTSFVSGANRTGAYLLSLAGAKKLLSKAYPVRLPADALTGSGFCPSLRLSGLHPSLGALLPVPSTFQKGSHQPNTVVWNRKVPSKSDSSLLVLSDALKPGRLWALRADVISIFSRMVQFFRS
jgi:glycosyl transferase family 25